MALWGWKGIPLIRRAGNRTPKVEPDPKQGIYNGTFRRISGRSYSATNHKEMVVVAEENVSLRIVKAQPRQ